MIELVSFLFGFIAGFGVLAGIIKGCGYRLLRPEEAEIAESIAKKLKESRKVQRPQSDI